MERLTLRLEIKLALSCLFVHAFVSLLHAWPARIDRAPAFRTQG